MISKFRLLIAVMVVMLLVINTAQLLSAQNEKPNKNFTNKHCIYDHLLNPREHPDYNRRHVRPPTWDTFGNRIRFTSLRGFSIRDGKIVGYIEEIEKYTRTYELGDVLWPSYSILFSSNLSDLVDEIKRRGIFLFDIWGYVPGSGPGGYWQQFKPPEGVFDLFESQLGERWLGMDVGEQDGRYVGGYAPQMYPSSANRFQQYLNFQRHFERMCDELGNKMATLVSLNFGHYFLKEGVYTLIGAETAQALPNAQGYYAFIRGAGKQYGVPWFGNVSVYNRWGYKTYGSKGRNYGPTRGTSLNLMKRLMYSHILYNSVCAGFESGFFEGNRLSPIGRIQQSAKRWVKQNGQPGVMLTPIALMLDFFSGWSFPRHLYTPNVYRVWGNLPYEAGDYLTDGIIDMLYPGYQNSSYFHDESGFITPTPYGDSADCILSDAEEWLLCRYPVLIVAGELEGGLEIRDKLQAYVKNGGRLIITAGSLAKLPGGIAGINIAGPGVRFQSGETIQFETTELVEDASFELCPLVLPSNARVLAKCGETPAVVEVSCGKGSIIVFASPFGVSAEPMTKVPVVSETDKPLPKPYSLLKHVFYVLDEVFRSQMLFEVGDELSLIICRKGPGEYTLGICNNSLKAKPFQIISHCGPIKSVRELELEQSEKKSIGYLPYGFENTDIGTSDARNIAGGDIRIFSVRIHEENIEPIPHISPPPRPRGRALFLRGIKSIKEEILSRPTFFEHFDRVVVDWKYIRQQEKNVLQKQAGWISRQKLGVIVDLTSGINLYPDLRLVNNIEEEYLASISAIEDVMEKMGIIGAHDLILSLHRFPENNFTVEQSWKSFETTLRELCRKAEARGITVHLRMCPGKPPRNVKKAIQFIARVGAKNLHLAPSIGMLLAGKTNPEDIAHLLKGKVGLWLASAPDFDIAGRLWNTNAPIAEYKQKNVLADIISIAPDALLVLDGAHKNQDEEYLDVCALETVLRPK